MYNSHTFHPWSMHPPGRRWFLLRKYYVMLNSILSSTYTHRSSYQGVNLSIIDVSERVTAIFLFLFVYILKNTRNVSSNFLEEKTIVVDSS